MQLMLNGIIFAVKQFALMRKFNLIMKKLMLLLIIFSFLPGCEKEQYIIPNEENFVKGDLDVGFKENASLKSSFYLVNKFGLEITQVWGFIYISDLPDDSIDYVINFLKTRQYLNNGTWIIVKNGNVFNHYSTGKIYVCCTMLNMTETNQTDWYNVVSILKLVEQPSVKVFYIKVPVGQEKAWRDKFRDQGIVKWAELNSWVKINPWP